VNQIRNSIQFIGSGDAFASAGKFNTCFHVVCKTHNFLIDCGASSLIALKKFEINLNQIDYIFLSHFHGDHFGGLPFFILDAQFVQNRKNPLTIIGPATVQERVTELMEAMFKGSSSIPFNFALNFIDATDFTALKIDDIEVTYYPVTHSPESCPHGLRVNTNGITIAYTGDTEWTETIVDLSEGADLLIMECYNYLKESKLHMSYKLLVENEARLKSTKIMLTHLGDDMIQNADKIKFDICSDGGIFHF